MRTWERLDKMRAMFDRELCEGREYKCPVAKTGQKGNYGPDITDFTMARPRVFIGFQPLRPNEPGQADPSDPYSVCPSITIMPCAGYARYMEEKRFDQRNNIVRPQDMGQRPRVQVLFSIYEPGVRLPGFYESMKTQKPDMRLLQDGTDEGLKTLLNWMDDAIELLLRERTIWGTDLILQDDNFMFSMFTDQEYVVDRRPIYYGILNVEFNGYASPGSDHGRRTRIDRALDG